MIDSIQCIIFVYSWLDVRFLVHIMSIWGLCFAKPLSRRAIAYYSLAAIFGAAALLLYVLYKKQGKFILAYSIIASFNLFFSAWIVVALIICVSFLVVAWYGPLQSKNSLLALRAVIICLCLVCIYATFKTYEQTLAVASVVFIARLGFIFLGGYGVAMRATDATRSAVDSLRNEIAGLSVQQFYRMFPDEKRRQEIIEFVETGTDITNSH